MSSPRKRYPIGVQDFEKLRLGGYVYVDKTRQLHALATQGSCYLLARPRRFGKSLLLSTLEAYFLGKRDLFRGLAIEALESDWTTYPVLHLDLNTGQYTSPGGLEEVLNVALTEWEHRYGKSAPELSPAMRLSGLVRRASEQTGRQVVILVDEYDKPLLSTLDNPELHDRYLAQLKALYSVLKTQDRHIRFAFLTGVTKFGQVSVFSDLNNLNDLSMDRRSADLCGITDAELRATFADAIADLAARSQTTAADLCCRLRALYDGYHFCADCPGVYNPFSLLKAFDSGQLGHYWFETGTPTFLVRLLRQADYRLERLQGGQVGADELARTESLLSNPTVLLYQSGYLTIRGYDAEFRQYTLGFPNLEVESGFMKRLLPIYSPDPAAGSPFDTKAFVTDVRQGRPDAFMARLQTFFEDADYRIAGQKEIYFQNIMFVVFRMLGFHTQVERATARGRVDVVIQTDGYIYVIECKLDGSAADALRQIDLRGYTRPFAHDPRPLFKVGVNFSSTTRGISEWKVEREERAPLASDAAR